MTMTYDQALQEKYWLEGHEVGTCIKCGRQERKEILDDFVGVCIRCDEMRGIIREDYGY